MAELYLLLVFIIIAALVAIENHNLLSSVISLGAAGLGLCVIFLLLGAPELALTQLVVEVLALIILVRATVTKTAPETYKGRELVSYSITGIFIIIFMAFAAYAFRCLPGFGFPAEKVAKYFLENGLSQTGAQSVVSAIALDFRAIDSLAAVAVIFAAVIGTLSILRIRGRKGINERDEIDS